MGASVQPEGGSRIERNIAALRAQGASEHDIESYLTQHEGLQPVAPAAPRSGLYSAVNTVDNALTGGLGQKFNAAYDALGDVVHGRDSFTHSFNKNLDAENAGLAAFRANHPIGSAVASGVGGGVQAVLAAPLAATGEVANGLSLAQRTAAAARTGGALTATAALGNAPNEGGILKNAGRAAVAGTAGAVLASAAVPASQAAGALGRRVGPLLSRAASADDATAPAMTRVMPRAAAIAGADAAPVASEQDPATQLLLRRLQRTGLTPQDALDRLAQIPESKPVTVAEVAGDRSDPVRKLVKLVARTPSTGGVDVRQAFGESGRAEPLANAKRVLGDVGDAMGVQRTNLVDNAASLRGQQLANARPFYSEAFSENTPPVPIDALASDDGPFLGDLLKRPSVKSAIASHNLNALERGEKPLAVGDEMQSVPLKTLQDIKFQLDDDLGFAKRNGKLPDGSAATKQKLSAINDTRLSLLKVMTDHSDAYAKGNASYAGDAALQDAGERGREFLSAPIDELQSNVAAMSPGERAQHNTTALSGPVRDRIFKTRAVDRAKLFTQPDVQERLQAVVPPDRLPVLQRNLGTEHQIALTHQAINGGSDTAENMLNQFDASEPLAEHAAKATSTALLRGPRHAAMDLFRKAIESQFAARLQGVNEKTADALAPMLTAGIKSRADATAMLDALATAFDRAQRQRGSLPYAGTAIGSGTGQLIARQR